MLRMIATILLLGCSVWDGMAGEPDSLTKRGRILAGNVRWVPRNW
jgi:hypothetical protein